MRGETLAKLGLEFLGLFGIGLLGGGNGLGDRVQCFGCLLFLILRLLLDDGKLSRCLLYLRRELL